jgi:hypothetical protein
VSKRKKVEWTIGESLKCVSFSGVGVGVGDEIGMNFR